MLALKIVGFVFVVVLLSLGITVVAMLSASGENSFHALQLGLIHR